MFIWLSLDLQKQVNVFEPIQKSVINNKKDEVGEPSLNRDYRPGFEASIRCEKTSKNIILQKRQSMDRQALCSGKAPIGKDSGFSND